MTGWWLVAAALAGKSITDGNHAGWRWHTLTTEHFRVHYPTSRRDPLGAELAAVRIAAEADGIWLRMGDVLDWSPTEPITVVVVDDRDALTAWAWPLRGAIVISARPAAELGRVRSRGDQLVDVFAHELAHVFTHKSACAFSERASIGADGWTHAEVGGIAAGARLPVAPTLPQWWSEGGAEYLAARVGHGWWSPGRMAGVRQALLEDRLLTWDELQVATDKDDVGDAELAYQQGHAFFRWLEAREGADAYARLASLTRRRARVDPNRALESLTGRSGRALYADHVADLRSEVAGEPTRGHAVVGRELWSWDQDWAAPELSRRDAWVGRPRRDRERTREVTGSGNLYPRWSPDGRWLAEHRSGWVRVRRSAEVDWPALQDHPAEPGVGRGRSAESRALDLWIPAAFGSGFAFVPGRDAVVVAGPAPLVGADLDGDGFTRLYLVDLTPAERSGRATLDHPGRRSTPIPGTERAFDPAVSPDGVRLAYARFRGGLAELVVARLDGSASSVIATMPPGGWLAGPSWSPDGAWIAAGVFHASRSDLWAFSADGGQVRPLTSDRWEEADPHWAADGLYFVADVDGVFDVFRLVPEDGRVDRVTRVSGAAATPSITTSGHLLYAHRTGHGWKSMALRRDGFAWEPVDRFGLDPAHPPPEVPEPAAPTPEPYRPIRSALPLVIAPELRVELEPSVGSGAVAGASFGTRDPAELLELWGRVWVGSDVLISGSFTVRVLPPDLAVWAQRELDHRVLVDGSRARVDADTIGVTLDWELVPDGFGVVAEARLRRLGFGGPAPVRLGETALGSVGVRVGDRGWTGRIGEAGASLVAVGTGAESRDPLGSTLPWMRATVDATAAADAGPLLLDGRAVAGATDRSVPVFDALRAGGDAPSALRLGWWEPSVSLSGFAPRTLAGEHLVVLGAGLLLPIRDLRRWLGGVYLDDLGVRVGGDVARAWGPTRPDALVVADLIAEARLAATAADQPWNSVVRVARGVGSPPPTGDPTDPARSPAPWRVIVGVGTGW